MHPDSATPPTAAAPTQRNTLYVQVLVGIVLGGLLGYAKPEWGVQLRPLGDAFRATYSGCYGHRPDADLEGICA